MIRLKQIQSMICWCRKLKLCDIRRIDVDAVISRHNASVMARSLNNPPSDVPRYLLRYLTIVLYYEHYQVEEDTLKQFVKPNTLSLKENLRCVQESRRKGEIFTREIPLNKYYFADLFHFENSLIIECLECLFGNSIE